MVVDAPDQEDLLELLVSHRGGSTYCVEARCEGHEPATAEVTLPGDLLRELENLQIAVTVGAATRGARGAAARRNAQPQIIREFGTRLFDFLITRAIFNLYSDLRAEAERRERRVRVSIRLGGEQRDLARLPWEALYDRDRLEYLATSPRAWLTRVAAKLDAGTRVTSRIRILVVVADARDDGTLDEAGRPAELDEIVFSREIRWMKEALKPLHAEGLVDYAFARGTIDEVEDRLYARGAAFDVFHFIGHGGYDEGRGEGYLVFKRDGSTGGRRIYADRLKDTIATPDGPRLVVLNSCLGAGGGATDIFSTTAGRLALSGIPCIVAMQFRITNEAAQEFSRRFYRRLAGGLPVHEAVRLARLGMTETGPEWITPVLYSRSRTGRLFEFAAEGT